ncbi:sensor histidine kinase [Sutcliffiella cohnii]
MKWWIKTCILLVILVLIIMFERDQSLAGVIFFFGVFFTFYFNVPIMKVQRLTYFLLASITFCAHILFFSETNIFLFLIYYFLLIDVAISSAKEEEWKIQLLIVAPSLLYPFFYRLDTFFLFHLCITGLIFMSAYLLQQLSKQKLERDKEWKTLLVEYRKVKRQVVEHEKEARLQERTRIARDIHDSVGHQLTALMMQLAVAEHQVTTKEVKVLIGQSKDLASSSLEEMRKAVKTLKEDTNKGMASVIHLIRKLEAESHIRVALTTKTGVLSTNLSNEQNVVLYRFVQEGLTNAMRHAHSREINVTMELAGNHTFMMTMENAIHDHKERLEEGFGLSNMRERFMNIGGNIQYYILNGKFILKGTFPLEERLK